MPRGRSAGMRRVERKRPSLNESDWAFLNRILDPKHNGKWTVEVFNGHIVKAWEPGAPVEVDEEAKEPGEAVKVDKEGKEPFLFGMLVDGKKTTHGPKAG